MSDSAKDSIAEAEGKVFYLEGFHNAAILTLNEMLKRAEAGELTGLFIAATTNQANTLSCGISDEDEGNVFELVGVIEAAKYTFMSNHIEQ